MKRNHMSRLILCAVLCAALLLCGCSKLHKLHSDGDVYVDRTTGVSYSPLSSCYEPVSRGEEYAKLDLAGVRYTLHAIGELAPTEYLCTVYNDVYCAEGVRVPTFEEWDISALYVCTNTAMTAAALVLDADNGTDAQLIRSLRDAYLNGTRVTYPSFYTVAESYTLRYAADNANGLYYCMTYIEYEEEIYDMIDGKEVNLGRCFLYDRYNKICVTVDGGLRSRLLGEDAQ